MALSDIILSHPNVLVYPSASEQGLIPQGGNKIRFGVVALIYDTCDKVALNSAVMYDESKASLFMYGSTFYWMVSVEFVTGTETPIP